MDPTGGGEEGLCKGVNRKDNRSREESGALCEGYSRNKLFKPRSESSPGIYENAACAQPC